MKKIAILILFTFFLTSCDDTRFAFLEAGHDNMNYESITNSIGNVYTKIGDSTLVYFHAKIVYSETDQMSMLIRTKENKYVYIQGPAVIEFDTIKVNPN
jgi:hypothetical protein